MAQGILYALNNASILDLLKIGMTTRSAHDRARDLSRTTGVPTPFAVVYQVEVSDAAAAERWAHERLAERRENSRREFFRVSVKDAITVLDMARARFKPAATPPETAREESASSEEEVLDLSDLINGSVLAAKEALSTKGVTTDSIRPKGSRRGLIVWLLEAGTSDAEILAQVDCEFPPGTFKTSNEAAIYGTKRDLGLLPHQNGRAPRRP